MSQSAAQLDDTEYDHVHKQWRLRKGDLATWLDDERRPVLCRIKLVTRDRVYLEATADRGSKRRGDVWFEARISRRVAHRDAVYVNEGIGHFDWRTVRIESDPD